MDLKTISDAALQALIKKVEWQLKVLLNESRKGNTGAPFQALIKRVEAYLKTLLDESRKRNQK